MSTQLPSSTAPEPATDRETLTAGDAPRIFDPFNTHDCPEMFRDKWAETTDGHQQHHRG